MRLKLVMFVLVTLLSILAPYLLATSIAMASTLLLFPRGNFILRLRDMLLKYCKYAYFDKIIEHIIAKYFSSPFGQRLDL